jgi:hypothetical protein
MRRQERLLPSEKELRKKAHELALFKRFCNIKPFEIVEGTLTQPPPPAPDIRVEILGNGFVGFELVCVDEPAYLRGLNLMPESARLLTDFYERRLSAGERSAFDERYRNAMLHVHFADTAGQRGVRRTLRPLFDALMRLPAGLQGPSLEDQLTRVDGVQYVYISRDESFSGPEFTTPTSGMLTGLNIGALEAKLDKTYESDRPVELLAYAMEVSRQADDDAIKALVDERMPGSSYRRVWVYEHMLGKATCHCRSAVG